MLMGLAILVHMSCYVIFAEENKEKIVVIKSGIDEADVLVLALILLDV